MMVFLTSNILFEWQKNLRETLPSATTANDLLTLFSISS